MNVSTIESQLKIIMERRSEIFLQPSFKKRGPKVTLQVKCSLGEAAEAINAWFHPNLEILDHKPPVPYVKISIDCRNSFLLTLCGSEYECTRWLVMTGLSINNEKATAKFCLGSSTYLGKSSFSTFTPSFDIYGSEHTRLDKKRMSWLDTQMELHKIQSRDIAVEKKKENDIIVDVTSTYNNHARHSITGSEYRSKTRQEVSKPHVIEDTFAENMNLVFITLPLLSLTKALENLDNNHTRQRGLWAEHTEYTLDLDGKPNSPGEEDISVQKKQEALQSGNTITSFHVNPSLGTSKGSSLVSTKKVHSSSQFFKARNYSKFNHSLRVMEGLVGEIVTESIKLEKREISAMIGTHGDKIRRISTHTECSIVLVPVTNEMLSSRGRGKNYLHTVKLSGTAQNVMRAKNLLRRALLEVRSQ